MLLRAYRLKAAMALKMVPGSAVKSRPGQKRARALRRYPWVPPHAATAQRKRAPKPAMMMLKGKHEARGRESARRRGGRGARTESRSKQIGARVGQLGERLGPHLGFLTRRQLSIQRFCRSSLPQVWSLSPEMSPGCQGVGKTLPSFAHKATFGPSSPPRLWPEGETRIIPGASAVRIKTKQGVSRLIAPHAFPNSRTRCAMSVSSGLASRRPCSALRTCQG